MASNSGEVLRDMFPFLRIYKDGRVERFKGTDVVPASTDPETGVQSKDVKISQEFNVSARLYLPKNAGHKIPLLVYFHGGGFVIESAFSPTYHKYLNLLAAEANVIIVSVDYRLAPEHLLPAAYEDSWLALKWVASHQSETDRGDCGPVEEWLKDYADFDRVYLGGDSAGANIAHKLAMKLGLEKLHGLNFVGIYLNCPYFWGKTPVGNEAPRAEGMDFAGKLWLFVNPTSSGVDDPLINPSMDPDLSKLGCKRALIHVAGNDFLKYRGWHHKEALDKSGWGGAAEVLEVEGEEHVFHLFSPTSENGVTIIKHFASFLNQDVAKH